MLIHLVAATVYVGYLLGPGLLICRILNWRRNRFFLAYGIGFCTLVLSQVPFRLLGGDVSEWYLLLHGLYLLLLLAAFGVRVSRANSRRSESIFITSYPVAGLVAVVAGFTIYHLLTGPYTEIPADFWARLGHVSEQLAIIESSQFPAVESIRKLFDDKAYVPFLHAVVAHKLGVLPLWLVTPATLVASLLFLVATYWFSLKLVARVRMASWQKVIFACLAVVLTLTIYGVATFSYVRYYAYFPHILNATLMLVVVVLFLDYLERSGSRFVILITVGVFLFVMTLVNLQEALMALVLLAILSMWKMIRLMRSRTEGELIRAGRVKVTAGIIVVLSAVALAVGFVFGTPSPLGKPHLVDLGEVFPILDGWPVANPTLRFWDTLGLFGVVVYVWYFLRWRWLRGFDYVNVAMFSPVLTLFNPLFVFWFLHIAWWDAVWRLSYLMPLPIVAAYLIVRSWSSGQANEAAAGKAIDRLMIVALVFCLVPFQIGQFKNDNSRVPSLVSVNRNNGALLWPDLVEYLETLKDPQSFVTDSATNYVLDTALMHQGLPRPKERWQKGDNFFKGDYKDKLLYYRMDNKLLIVNNRDGGISTNGRITGHWPPNILKVSKTYPPDILEFVDSHPLDFWLMWENDGIYVYRILRTPFDYE